MMEENSLTALLTAFFYQHGYLSLPELGSFQVGEGVDLPLDEPKKHQDARNNIRFVKNLKEEVDQELIKFIIERTRKMKSLATADLLTFSDQAKEMLNIGQPVSFEGIGTIKQTLRGGYEFTPGVYKANLISGFEENNETLIFPDEVSAMHDTQQPSLSRNRSLGGTLIIFFCLLIVAILIYFLVIFKNKPENKTVTEDAPASSLTVADTTTTEPKLPAGTIHYEVVFEHLERERAFRRYSQLRSWGHPVIMRTSDSVHFTLSIPFTTPPGDTAAMKDSIRILYGHPTTIRYIK